MLHRNTYTFEYTVSIIYLIQYTFLDLYYYEKQIFTTNPIDFSSSSWWNLNHPMQQAVWVLVESFPQVKLVPKTHLTLVQSSPMSDRLTLETRTKQKHNEKHG